MTLFVITIWLALQIPVGALLGRMLQSRRQHAVLIPMEARRSRQR